MSVLAYTNGLNSGPNYFGNTGPKETSQKPQGLTSSDLVAQLKAGRLDQLSAYSVLDHLNALHTSSEQNRNSISSRSLDAPQATACLRELARESLSNEKLRETLIGYACQKLKAAAGTDDPGRLFQLAGHWDDRSLSSLSSFEWSFALLGLSRKSQWGAQLQGRVIELFQRFGAHNGHDEMLRGGTAGLIRFLTPNVELGTKYRLPDDDPLKDLLYGALSFSNPLVRQLITFELDDASSENLIRWLLATQEEGADPKLKHQGAHVLANLIAPGGKSGSALGARAALCFNQVAHCRLVKEFGTDNVLAPMLLQSIDSRTVTRLSTTEWMYYFKEQGSPEKDRLKDHVLGCLKEAGVNGIERLALNWEDRGMLAASLKPHVRDRLDQLELVKKSPTERVLRQCAVRDLLSTEEWRTVTYEAITGNDFDPVSRARMLDVLSDLAEGRKESFGFYGRDPAPGREEIINTVMRARTVLSDLIKRARKDKGLLARLQEYGNQRYCDEFGALFTRKPREYQMHLFRQKVLMKIPRLALFYALDARRNVLGNLPKGEHKVMREIYHRCKNDGKSIDYASAIDRGSTSSLLKYFKNDELHQREFLTTLWSHLRPGTRLLGGGIIIDDRRVSTAPIVPTSRSNGQEVEGEPDVLQPVDRTETIRNAPIELVNVQPAPKGFWARLRRLFGAR